MKAKSIKTMVLALAGLAFVTSANAEIFRLNNTPGSAAPYSDFESAYDAAQDGDTIMVETSEFGYGNITIAKRLTIIGPGYWRVKNGFVGDGAETAAFGEINIKKDGCKIFGLTTGHICIFANNTVVSRCNTAAIQPAGNCVNTVIHQNFIREGIYNQSYSQHPSGFQITNNIILDCIRNYSSGCDIRNAYIAYNTYYRPDKREVITDGIIESTIEHNLIICKPDYILSTAKNSVKDNLIVTGGSFKVDEVWDKSIQEAELAFKQNDGNYGAFSTAANSDPYVISGMPKGPTITSIELPASIEKGNNMKVTVNVSLTR